MPLTLEEKKELLVDHIDPDFLIEVLDVKTETLVELLEDRILDNWDRFEYLEGDLISDYQQEEET